jgi:hypothetical protein
MRIISFGVVAVALVAGCGLTDPDQSVILGVSKLDAPTTVASGSTITAVLTVTLGGCLSFDHIQVTRDASGANVTVWGNDASKGNKGVTCTSDVKVQSRSVQFDPPFANSFTIEVNQGRLGPLMAVVQVQ